MFEIYNRRYTGSKYKLVQWIRELVNENCTGSKFFDVFAGTGVVTDCLIHDYQNYIINDFLYSNEIIYRGFFGQEAFSQEKLENVRREYGRLNRLSLNDNYVSMNFGNKFFSVEDARAIGYIRQDIEDKLSGGSLNVREYCILLASLLYSLDRSANTVGHYDAYIKGKTIRGGFLFDLIHPVKLSENQQIEIFREDANELVKRVRTDIAFIDPPYNSRQYSRFYHVLENIAQWKKPELFGTAMKPQAENMSDYCKISAPGAFDELISNLRARYIVVTYNNTYHSKSSSSRNKIMLEQLEEILNKKGNTKSFEKNHKFFNAGKTDFDNHKEFVFITECTSIHNT